MAELPHPVVVLISLAHLVLARKPAHPLTELGPVEAVGRAALPEEVVAGNTHFMGAQVAKGDQLRCDAVVEREAANYLSHLGIPAS